jgi:hypothetical protein
MQQEAKYILKPDESKGLKAAFHIRSNHAVVSLTLLPEERDCLRPGRSVFYFYFTCETIDKVQK